MFRFHLYARELDTTRPLWQRWAAAFALALVAIMGTAQAVHIHGDLLPSNKVQLHAAPADALNVGGEERCPLCVAMHTTLPVMPVQYEVIEMVEHVTPIEEAEIARATLWHSVWFSRPPPASSFVS
ncbi:hypothetical protein ACFQBQ_09365 [Granulicella cerasi]|uniref:DUF2946 domain-containing protein n=1 Tax=Granulicella cerasi TaxID=741063 RepID=A0ABW1Z9E0_9BACT|nr:hypothetical protein [Granulicella cerasi]